MPQKRNRKRQGTMRKKIGSEGGRILRGIGERHMGTYASSTTFYYFLAIVPILIFVSAMLPMTGMKEHDLENAVTSVTPEAVDGLVRIIIAEAYSHASNLLPISIITLLWTSIQGNLALLQGLNDVYQVKEHRSYLRLILISLFWTAVLMILFLILAYFIFSNQIREFFMTYIPAEEHRIRTFTNTRKVICFFIAAFIFALFYTFMPAGKRRYLRQLPGAVFTAAVWMLFSVLFALYVNGINKYTAFYGSIGTFAILLFWMYCCFYILLAGGFINCHYKDSIGKVYGKIREKTENHRNRRDRKSQNIS